MHTRQHFAESKAATDRRGRVMQSTVQFTMTDSSMGAFAAEMLPFAITKTAPNGHVFAAV